jgi:SAM-dependent methyltransferase
MTDSLSNNPETGAALARLYDVDLLDDPGDVDLYLALAARTGGPVLEIAAGSGRVAIPLAEAGYDVTLVDIDPAMLARADALAAESGLEGKIDSVRTDLVGLELAGGPKFGLCILALNSLLLLGSIETQKEALLTLARHLKPEGLAVVDVWVPSADELARYDGRLSLEYVREDPETGNVVTKMAAAQYEPARGEVVLSVLYDEGAQGEQPRRWTRVDRLKLVNADQLAFLAESAGLEVEAIGGDYEMSPAGPYDERVILVARRRGGPAPLA